jgi:hypothetical protein
MKRLAVVSDELVALAYTSAQVTMPRDANPVAVPGLDDTAGHGDRPSWVLERENTTHQSASHARPTASARGCEDTTRNAGRWLNPAVTVRRLTGLVALAGLVYIAVRARRARIGSTRPTPRKPPRWLAPRPTPEPHVPPPEQP